MSSLSLANPEIHLNDSKKTGNKRRIKSEPIRRPAINKDKNDVKGNHVNECHNPEDSDQAQTSALILTNKESGMIANHVGESRGEHVNRERRPSRESTV